MPVIGRIALTDASKSSPKFTLPRTKILRGRGGFDPIFNEGKKVVRGPLVMLAKKSELPHMRMGISISKRVGQANMRNRIKRLLREAFRLMQYDWPTMYDVVLIVRPHKTLMLADYQKLLSGMMVKIAND